jgi:flagellar biosynthesis protein
VRHERDHKPACRRAALGPHGRAARGRQGQGRIGAKIIEVAKAHDIPIEENEVLAGALSHVELGDEIPAELYKAVAEVLVFVLKLTRPARKP